MQLTRHVQKLSDTRLLGSLLAILISSCGPSDLNINQSPKNGAAREETSPQTKEQGSKKKANPLPGRGSTNPGDSEDSGDSNDDKLTDKSEDTLDSNCYKGSAFICKIEVLITKKTNEYRTSNGRAAVTHDPKIAFASRDWSMKQGRRGSIGHDGFPRARMAVYQQEFGTSQTMRGENVAMFSGFSSGAETDEEAERIASRFAVMWWNSTGHRINMLVKSHRTLGVGVARTPRGAYYATQIFN
jgi:uncharacterized protein YkwD